MQARMLIALILLFGLPGCAYRRHVAQPASCDSEQNCIIEGKLNFFAGHPPLMVLEGSNNVCYKLALPDFFYASSQKWDGKKVRVFGKAFQQPRFDQTGGAATLWYLERDRKVVMGICDQGMGIYVESMKSNSDLQWRTKEGGGN